MNYQESIDFLFPLRRFGIKPGLERVLRLLDAAGSPQNNLGRVFHIAGTNGKGAVATALGSTFAAAGYRTALYTSPHLRAFTERIRFGGACISRGKVAEYCSLLEKAVGEAQATFFEATTAIAFRYFSDMGAEVSVIETGMGGRLDATNVVKPEAVLVPSIGKDHTAWLGDSLAEIAAEKAAVIKRGSKAYTAVTDPEALRPLRERAAAEDVHLALLDGTDCCRVDRAEIGDLRFSLRAAGLSMDDLRAPLTGAFQATNLSLAVLAAHEAGVEERAVRRGLETMLESGYRARLERVARRPDLLVDVSHNPDGIRRSVETFRAQGREFGETYVILGLAGDKDAAEMVRALKGFTRTVFTVNLSTDRGLPAPVLGELCRREGFHATVCDTAAEALRQALGAAGHSDLVLVTGSFYLAGEVLGILERGAS